MLFTALWHVATISSLFSLPPWKSLSFSFDRVLLPTPMLLNFWKEKRERLAWVWQQYIVRIFLDKCLDAPCREKQPWRSISCSASDRLGEFWCRRFESGLLRGFFSASEWLGEFWCRVFETGLLRGFHGMVLGSRPLSRKFLLLNFCLKRKRKQLGAAVLHMHSIWRGNKSNLSKGRNSCLFSGFLRTMHLADSLLSQASLFSRYSLRRAPRKVYPL